MSNGLVVERFQSLVGTLKTRWPRQEAPGNSRVSIPRRYAKNPSPFNCANTIDFEFQSLVGTLKTGLTLLPWRCIAEFQSLVGTLKTHWFHQ